MTVSRTALSKRQKLIQTYGKQLNELMSEYDATGDFFTIENIDERTVIKLYDLVDANKNGTVSLGMLDDSMTVIAHVHRADSRDARWDPTVFPRFTLTDKSRPWTPTDFGRKAFDPAPKLEIEQTVEDWVKKTLQSHPHHEPELLQSAAQAGYNRHQVGRVIKELSHKGFIAHTKRGLTWIFQDRWGITSNTIATELLRVARLLTNQD